MSLRLTSLSCYRGPKPVVVLGPLLAVGLGLASPDRPAGSNGRVPLPAEMAVRINCVQFAPWSRIQLATGSDDGTVRLWDLEKKKVLVTLNIGDGLSAECMLPFAQQFLLIGCAEMGRPLGPVRRVEVQLWNLERQQKVSTFKGPSNPIRGMCLAVDRKTLAVTDGSRELRLYDMVTFDSKQVLRCDAPIQAMTRVGQTNKVAIVSSDGSVSLCDLNAPKLERLKWSSSLADADRHSLRLAPTTLSNEKSNQVAAIACCVAPALRDQRRETPIILLDVQRDREIGTLGKESENCHALVVSVDGKVMVTAHADGLLRVWNPRAEQVLASVRLEGIVPDCPSSQGLSLSHDGKYLATIHRALREDEPRPRRQPVLTVWDVDVLTGVRPPVR